MADPSDGHQARFSLTWERTARQIREHGLRRIEPRRASKDTKPGDTNGQGVLNIWHVLCPAGKKITTPNPKQVAINRMPAGYLVVFGESINGTPPRCRTASSRAASARLT